MNLLSRVSYYKIHVLATMCEIRSTLYQLGLMSGERTEEKNKRDVMNVADLVQNLNSKDMFRLCKYNAKHFHEGVKGGLEK